MLLTPHLLSLYFVLAAVLGAMERYPDEKLQAACCNALRNLFSHVILTDRLLEDGNTERAIVDAMELHKHSSSIQEDACSVLWNMVYKSEEPSKVVSSQGVKCIVRAMQLHLESTAVLEQACGTLWTLVDASMETKKDVVASGAIDAGEAKSMRCKFCLLLFQRPCLTFFCSNLCNCSFASPGSGLGGFVKSQCRGISCGGYS